jgi:hypothetical protein
VDEFERVHWLETHTSIERCGSIESAGTEMRYPMKPRTWLLMRT